MKNENKIKTSEDKAHATYGASSSERWLSCPGSIKLALNAPPQPESKYAEEGTKAHACLEFMLRSLFKTRNLGRAVKATEESGLYETEMIKHAKEACKIIGGISVQVKGKIYCESKVDASSFTRPGEFGTLDVAIIGENKLVIADYKYGAGVAVEPEENSQLIYYALAEAEKHDYLFDEVEMVVIQPRAYHEKGPVRSWTTTMEHLLSEWFPKFLKGVEICESEDAPLLAGDHCRWCPASTICPEISNKALRRAQVVFDDLTMENVKAPSPTTLQIKNLPQILEACDQLETWIEAVRNHAFHVMQKGELVKGFKLVNKRSTRKWVDKDKVARIASKHFGEKAFSRSLLSPAQLEEALKGEKKVEKFIEQFTTNESSGLTMVREDDNRKAVNYLETIFDDLTGSFGVSENKKSNKKGVTKMSNTTTTTQVTTPTTPVTAAVKTTKTKVAKKATTRTTKKVAVKASSKKTTTKTAAKKTTKRK